LEGDSFQLFLKTSKIYIQIKNVFSIQAQEKVTFIPPEIGNPALILPVSPSKLQETVLLNDIQLVHVIFETANISESKNKRRKKIEFWVYFTGIANTRFLMGQLTEKLVELLGLGVTSMLSNKMAFRRVNL